VIDAGSASLLVGAGIVAGIVGTAGGITSLVSYPALLVVGCSPLAASVANIVAVVACLPGSVLASREELKGQGSRLKHTLWVTVVGGVIGAALLVTTPAPTFARVVPYLVAAASILLLAQPKLSAWAGRLHRGHRSMLLAGLLAIMTYNGYFGAGAGIMTLTLVLVTVEGDLPRANALKNVLVGTASVVAAAALVVLGPVQFAAVVPLGAGLALGATIGPRVTRILSPSVLRPAVALLGLGLALELLVGPK
jgi:uncharacterized membrane protein YfcA